MKKVFQCGGLHGDLLCYEQRPLRVSKAQPHFAENHGFVGMFSNCPCESLDYLKVEFRGYSFTEI